MICDCTIFSGFLQAGFPPPLPQVSWSHERDPMRPLYPTHISLGPLQKGVLAACAAVGAVFRSVAHTAGRLLDVVSLCRMHADELVILNTGNGTGNAHEQMLLALRFIPSACHFCHVYCKTAHG